jgi:23S rRNA C2498 (ribose-2'-O)-methylase RlmM
MLLIIESNDTEAIKALSAAAKALKVRYRVESSDTDNLVSQAERKRRLAVIRQFKGGLAKFVGNWQPNKHDWYQQ